MINEWPSLLKIVPISAFGRRFLVEFSQRSSWLSQETSEILRSDGVIFYTDGSLCEGRAGLGFFSDYKGISLATVFQTELYAILACSDYCRSATMHNLTICICSDSKVALLALSSYPISSKLVHQCWLSLQDLSYNNRADCFGCQVTDRLATRLIGCREWARTPISVDRSLVFYCQLQLSGI
jgi:hypothetical protein